MKTIGRAGSVAVLMVLALAAAVPAYADQGQFADLLKTTLESIQAGRPNLSSMEPVTADAVEQQIGVVRPILQRLGKILSVTYRGLQTLPGGSGEAYRVRFESGSMLWVISESSAGKIQILWTSGQEATASPNR
jgi:hypothetical protein